MDKINYSNFTDYYVGYKKYYKDKHNIIPPISLIVFEEFLNKINSNFIEKCRKEIEFELYKNCRYFYLFVIVTQNQHSDKIFDYYKVWKKLKGEVQILQKGVERKYNIKNRNVYVGVASFDLKNIHNILSYLLYNQNTSFVYACNNKNILQTEKSVEIYNNIFIEENILSNSDLYSLTKLFNRIEQNEIIIRTSFDGEKVGIDLFEKYED